MKKLFFALALVLLPASAWAGGCGCGSINAMISAAKSETIQAVNAYTAAEAEAIRSEILLAAQNIIGTIRRNRPPSCGRWSRSRKATPPRSKDRPWRAKP